MAKTKRRDKSRVVLRTGESQRADGTYHYSWTDANRKRRYVYAKTLDELRYKEEQIEKDKKDGIKAEARYTTLNDMYELWKDLKRGLKNNTFENYKYMYETFVRMEKERQELLDIHCEAVVDGYTDFIFLNRFGQPQHQATLNKAIRRIIRDCNDEQLLKDENAKVLLPHFSCHSLRHTFTTRMCEAGVNVKVIQDTLGHKDISTTLNIYTDVTKELRRSEFEGLDSYFKNEYNKANEVL